MKALDVSQMVEIASSMPDSKASDQADRVIQAVNDLANELAGTLDVETQGARISRLGLLAFFEPKSVGDQCPAILERHDDTGQWEKARPPKILFCDDDVNTLTLAQEFLSASQMDVVVAETAEQAWELYQQDEFDGLVTDVVLPENDGFWLVDNIAKLRDSQGLPTLPVVTISGNAEPERANRELGLVGGMLHHQKPVDWPKLAAWLNASCSYLSYLR